MSDINESRGIKNTSVQYTERLTERLTPAQKRRVQYRNQQKRRAYSEQKPTTDESYKSYYTDADYKDLKGDAQFTTQDKADEPSFPFIILIFAILKDSLDVVLELFVITIPLTTALSFIFSIILFFWFLGKIQGVWWKKRAISWLWKRLAVVVIIEHIPILKIIPSMTILVLMAHYRETKLVKIMNAVLEELHSGGFIPK